MATFPPNDIIDLTAEAPRYDLAESYGPGLRLADLLTPELNELLLGYGTAAGGERLRAVLAERHGVEPDQVLVTVGGMHAIFLLAYLLVEGGGQVVTTAPLFPNTRNCFESVGADIRVVSLTFDGGYQVTSDAVRAQLTAETKLVSLATPQNPSGVAVARETLAEVLAAMAEICPAAYLMVDETYRIATYGDDPAAATAAGLGAKVVVTSSLSKCHGAAGLRIGWIVTTDAELTDQLVRAKFNTVVSASPLTEALALRVLELEDQLLPEQSRDLGEAFATTAAWVEANDDLVEWIRPDAGALCCIRLRPDVFGPAALTRFTEATATENVRVASGNWFAAEPGVFRLGFGLPTAPDLKLGLDALTTALRNSADCSGR